MKITKVETFLVRWGDVSRPAEAVLGSTSATAVVAIHADGRVGMGEASPMQGGVASLQVIASEMAPALIGADVLDHADGDDAIARVGRGELAIVAILEPALR